MKYRILLVIILGFYLLLLPLVPNAHAAERWEEGWNAAITYEFDAATGTVTLSGTGEITINTSYKPWGNYPKDVKKVVIGEGITGIAANTFSSLQNLTEVVLPKSLTSIGRCAFMSCGALQTIDLSHITSIGEYAFDSCHALTAVNISSVTSMDSYAFRNSGLQSITIPEGISAIPRGAFMNCNALSELILHDQVTKIGYDSFNDCYQLTSLRMPKGLKELDDFAFADCIRLTDIQLNEGLEIIGRSAFNGCTGIKTLVIPDSVKTIEDDAFVSCSNLQSIHFGAKLSDITYTTFARCTNLTTFTISKNNPTWEIHNNGLYNKKTKELEAVAPGYAGAYVVPEGTLTIGRSAFEGCSVLQNIVFGKGLQVIEQSAFARCSSLVNVKFPDGLTTIGNQAFDRSPNFHIVVLPTSMKSIGANAFYAVWHILFKGTENQWNSLCPYGPDVIATSGETVHFNCTGNELKSEVVAPTCTAVGYTQYTCTICKEYCQRHLTDAIGHSYGAWYVAKEATFASKGIERRDCKNCEKYESKDIPMKTHTDKNNDSICDDCGSKYCTNHTEQLLTGKSATCTQDGLTDGKKCSICDAILQEQEAIPASGHNYGEWTPTTEGLEERVCALCGEKEQRQMGTTTPPASSETSSTLPTTKPDTTPIKPVPSDKENADPIVIILIVTAVVAVAGGVTVILIKKKK